MATAIHESCDPNQSLPIASRGRALLELAVAYTLILLVVWTPRPLQVLLWWVAASGIAVMGAASFKSYGTLGLRTENLLRSMWVVVAALLATAIAVFAAIHWHTLNVPDSAGLFIARYWAYAVWSGIQQLVLQGFFLPRTLVLAPGKASAALISAGLFALAHLPNLILTPVTFVWGIAACLLFLRYRNLYSLAVAHAIFGITIAITIPGPVDHNMRVGLGYLTYHAHRHHG